LKTNNDKRDIDGYLRISVGIGGVRLSMQFDSMLPLEIKYLPIPVNMCCPLGYYLISQKMRSSISSDIHMISEVPVAIVCFCS
jgi:hypothetical protein